MAVVIERQTPAWPLYPWKLWTDGRTYAATKGADFDCDVDSFRSSLYSHGRRHKIPVEVWRNKADANVIEFRFTPKPVRKPAKRRK